MDDLPRSAEGAFQIKGTQCPEWLETMRWRVLGVEVLEITGARSGRAL